MALALWPTLASAQDSPPDTIPFHRHQWAAQFAGGTSFASLGVLRFTAPTRAWLLDFRFTGGSTRTTRTMSRTRWSATGTRPRQTLMLESGAASIRVAAKRW